MSFRTFLWFIQTFRTIALYNYFSYSTFHLYFLYNYFSLNEFTSNYISILDHLKWKVCCTKRDARKMSVRKVFVQKITVRKVHANHCCTKSYTANFGQKQQ